MQFAVQLDLIQTASKTIQSKVMRCSPNVGPDNLVRFLSLAGQEEVESRNLLAIKQ